jgi:polyhydroxyalkanoate depolymerase
VFQRALLAKGQLAHDGRPVNPGAIRDTILLTVEGERDDVCGLGQTAAAHDLCTGIPESRRHHHLQRHVGHYGIFSGRRWENEIYPILQAMIARA